MVCLAQVHKVHLNPNTLDFTPKLHGLSGRRVRIIQVLAKNIDPDLTGERTPRQPKLQLSILSLNSTLP